MIDFVPKILTKRLELRPLEKTDAQAVYELRSDPKVNQFLLRKPYQEKEEAVQFISYIKKGIQDKKWLYWGISFLEDPDLIGTICLWNFLEEDKKGEIGYELKSNLHGFGLMSEALAPILRLGHETLGLSRICASTHYKNKASIQLLHKFQFQRNPAVKFEVRPEDWYFERYLELGSSPNKE